MTICFENNTTFAEIGNTLAGIKDADITVCYENGDTEHYNRRTTNPIMIVSSISNHLTKIRNIINEILCEQTTDAVEEENDERYQAMYEAYLAEMEYRYDAEDATMHHYYA